MKEYQGEKVIVSLTSYGKRLNHVPKTIFSILKGTFKSVHIVLCLYKEDVDKIPLELQILINNNLIEVIVADENLRPHLKYFYTMLKYKETPIVTIDDDMIYYPNTIEELYNSYKKFNCVCSRRCREMTFNNGKINKFQNWIWHTFNKKPSNRIHALGFSGVIYPPNCLKIKEDLINEIKNHCLRADDIYLNILEIRNKIPVYNICCNCKNGTNMIESKGKNALSLDNDNIKVTNEYINYFSNVFNTLS